MEYFSSTVANDIGDIRGPAEIDAVGELIIEAKIRHFVHLFLYSLLLKIGFANSIYLGWTPVSH